MKPLRMIVLLFGLGVSLAAAGPAPTPDRETQMLWRDPGQIAQRDLRWGAGSEARAPKPPFTFVEENTSGNRPKLVVNDAAGAEWTVKLAGNDPLLNEVHAEIAATRILWALGFFVDENYYVPGGTINGAMKLTRAAEEIGPDGSFKRARFERHDADIEKIGDWNIEDNVFKGTKELSAFKAAMLLLNSWDVKPLNTAVRRRKGDDKTEYFLLSDLGSTFGGMKAGNKNSRWHVEEYKASPFVSGVVMGNQLRFAHPLLTSEVVAIPLEHARWFTGLLSQLTDTQISQAFEASGATPAEVAAFSAAFKARIVALKVALGKA